MEADVVADEGQVVRVGELAVVKFGPVVIPVSQDQRFRRGLGQLIRHGLIVVSEIVLVLDVAAEEPGRQSSAQHTIGELQRRNSAAANAILTGVYVNALKYDVIAA